MSTNINPILQCLSKQEAAQQIALYKHFQSSISATFMRTPSFSQYYNLLISLSSMHSYTMKAMQANTYIAHILSMQITLLIQQNAPLKKLNPSQKKFTRSQIDQAIASICTQMQNLINKITKEKEHSLAEAKKEEIAVGVYHNKGDYQNAIKHCDKIIELYSNSIGFTTTEVGNALYNKGLSYFESKDITESEPIFRKAIETCTAAASKVHLTVLESYLKLSEIYRLSGEFQKRLNALMEIYDVQTLFYQSENNIDNAAVCYNIANVYLDRNLHEDAISYFCRALHIRLSLNEECTKAIFQICNNLAISYKCLGNLQKSIEYRIKAIGTYTTVFGEYSQILPNLGEQYVMLALIYNDLHQLSQWREHLHKAIDIFAKCGNYAKVNLLKQMEIANQ